MTTADFAHALAQARQEGGAALQALAESHLPLVGLALRRYPDTGQDREELYQQGKHGVKAGAGFYDYSGDKADKSMKKRDAMYLAMAKANPTGIEVE